MSNIETRNIEGENGTATIQLTYANEQYTVTTHVDGFWSYEETTYSRKQADKWMAAEEKQCRRELCS